MNGQARLTRFIDQLVAWIRDQRRSGITGQGDDLALFQPIQNTRPHFCPIVIVVCLNTRGKTHMLQQFGGDPAILGQNHVCAGKHLNGAPGHITEIADRGRDDIKSRRKSCFSGIPCRGRFLIQRMVR